jgi:hypothetical protein
MSSGQSFDDGDPFDDPLWKEAERTAQAAKAGVANLSANYIVCPVSWLEQVLPLARSAGQLAAALLLYRRLRRDKAVPVSNAEFEEFGIGRDVKYRILVELERAGLVAIERATGRSVAVRLL